jgi:baculoviral IAP repeat-containing protein 6
MSSIFYKNDFNISIKEVNNGVLCDILSWDTNNFDKEIKINNFINNTLYLTAKEKFDFKINFDNLSYSCCNLQLENLIKKNLTSDIINFLDNINTELKKIEIEENNNKIDWNPYDYLNTKKHYPFDINLLIRNAYNNNFDYLEFPKEHIIDQVIDEIKLLSDNNFELVFNDNNLFNFDVKLKTIEEVFVNVDLSSFHYPYYPPLISFYNKFNDNIENKITNLYYWSDMKDNNLNSIMNDIKVIIDKNEMYEIEDNFKKLHLLICKIVCINDLSYEKKKNNIVKHFMELNLCNQLLNEINLVKSNDNFDSFIQESKLSDIIEYYVSQYNLLKLDMINNYKIFNIIIDIVEKINYNIVDLNKFDILQKEIIEYNNINDPLFKKILNYKITDFENNNLNDEYTSIMKEYSVNEFKFKNHYFNNFPCSSTTNNNFMKRISKEIISYKNLSLVSNDTSIFIKYDKYDYKKLMALITGPKNTPYENGCFIFHILLDDYYPNLPPKIYFETTMHFHPYLNKNGEIILSKFEKWNKDQSTLMEFLILIQKQIFQNKEIDDLYNTFKFNILHKITNPNEEFKDVIINHFKLKKNDLILKIQNNNNLKDLEIIEKLNHL